MIKYKQFGHVSVIVDDLTEAAGFYQQVFGAVPIKLIHHLKNRDYGLSSGYVEKPEKIDVSLGLLAFPKTDLILELTVHHESERKQSTAQRSCSIDELGLRHIAMEVTNLDETFDWLKNQAGVSFVSGDVSYSPIKMNVKPDDIHDPSQTEGERQQTAAIVSAIRFFYCIDKYGTQWEFTEMAGNG